MSAYPGTYQAAIARAKRVLIAAGFPWSKTSGRYSPFTNEQVTTLGMRVTRIGCSTSVSVSVHGWSRLPFTSELKERMHFMQKWAVITLREAGLPFDDRGWLECAG